MNKSLKDQGEIKGSLSDTEKTIKVALDIQHFSSDSNSYVKEITLKRPLSG